eukprot:GILK01011237.1.p1 GENE.GILK01011237.1~~GILK01011237.1.p1  ORF type:complete len:545 (+),score=116.46 GILK01011237.1:66-1637(+)
MDTPRATGFPSRPSITHFSIPNNLTPRSSASTVAVSIRRSLLDAVIRPPHTRSQQSTQHRTDSTRSLFESEQDDVNSAAAEESPLGQVKDDLTVDSAEDENHSERRQHIDSSPNEEFEPIEMKLSTTRLRAMGGNDVGGGDSKSRIQPQVTTMSQESVATYDELADDSASRFSDEFDLLMNHPLLSPPSQKKSIHLSRSPILSVLESTDSMRLLQLDDRTEFGSNRFMHEQGEDACDGSEEEGLELLNHHLLSPKKQIASQSPSRRAPSSPLTKPTISGLGIESNMSIDTEDITALLDHPLLSPSKQKRDRLSNSEPLLVDSPANQVKSNDGPARPLAESLVYSSPSHANLSPVSKLDQLRERMASLRKESASSLDFATESNGASGGFSSDPLSISNETEVNQKNNVESALESLKIARGSSSLSSLNDSGCEGSDDSSPSARFSAIKNRLSSFRASISADVTVTVNQGKGIHSPVGTAAPASQLDVSGYDELTAESLRDNPPSPSSRLSKILASLRQNDADLE